MLPIRMTADNVLLELEERPEEVIPGTGIVIVRHEFEKVKNERGEWTKRRTASSTKYRTARVIAVGPGHMLERIIRNKGDSLTGPYAVRTGARYEMETKPGDRVIVGWQCGEVYHDCDTHRPRVNKATEFDREEDGGKRREFRIVREDEIEAVIEDDARAA